MSASGPPASSSLGAARELETRHADPAHREFGVRAARALGRLGAAGGEHGPAAVDHARVQPQSLGDELDERPELRARARDPLGERLREPVRELEGGDLVGDDPPVHGLGHLDEGDHLAQLDERQAGLISGGHQLGGQVPPRPRGLDRECGDPARGEAPHVLGLRRRLEREQRRAAGEQQLPAGEQRRDLEHLARVHPADTGLGHPCPAAHHHRRPHGQDASGEDGTQGQGHGNRPPKG
ncbi:hypothetical protein GCM10007172_23380 [Sinomonas atrocyanea]|nr:hypothetical protein GCM10007172_23380 [Sinomonas atrocyanea]